MELLPLSQQLVFAFFLAGIRDASTYRADLGALGRAMSSYTFSAFVGVDDINAFALFNRLIRAFRFARSRKTRICCGI